MFLTHSMYHIFYSQLVASNNNKFIKYCNSTRTEQVRNNIVPITPPGHVNRNDSSIRNSIFFTPSHIEMYVQINLAQWKKTLNSKVGITDYALLRACASGPTLLSLAPNLWLTHENKKKKKVLFVHLFIASKFNLEYDRCLKARVLDHSPRVAGSKTVVPGEKSAEANVAILWNNLRSQQNFSKK